MHWIIVDGVIAFLLGMWLGIKIQSVQNDSYEERQNDLKKLQKQLNKEYKNLTNVLEGYKECFDIYGRTFNKVLDENIELKKKLK